jgi:hypothetical protein
VVLLAAAAMLAVFTRDSRRQARMGECIGNLGAIGRAGAAYGEDNADRVWTFSWKKTGANAPSNPTSYGDLSVASTDQDAAAKQAVHILRTRARREDIATIPAWLPNLLYSQLVLAEYVNASLPFRSAVCSEDKNRLRWAADPFEYDRCTMTPSPGCGNGNQRWPYSSSYQLPPSFFSPDAAGGVTAPMVYQVGNYNNFSVAASVLLGRRRQTEARYPAQKVLLHDAEARHYSPRGAFFAYEEARQPLLMVGGSVGVRVTRDANLGGQPNNPSSPLATVLTYSPAPPPNNWEAPPLSGTGDAVYGHYRWARCGMRGRDFGGAEVPYACIRIIVRLLSPTPGTLVPGVSPS